jgi:phage shock protein A
MNERLERIERKVDRILDLLQGIARRSIMAANTLDDILNQVQQESTVDDSIIALLNGLQAQIAAAGGNQVKIDAIFTAAQANIAKVSAAVVANTPAA